MRTLTISRDNNLSFETAVDGRTGELVILGRWGRDNGRELGRFSVADLVLSFERMFESNMGSQSLLTVGARINMTHGEEARRNELEQRTLAAFRRWSYLGLECGSDNILTDDVRSWR